MAISAKSVHLFKYCINKINKINPSQTHMVCASSDDCGALLPVYRDKKYQHFIGDTETETWYYMIHTHVIHVGIRETENHRNHFNATLYMILGLP